MLQQDPGPLSRSIINISSVSASHVSPDRLDYCISKAALAMWSRRLAVRFAKDGIGVFDVRPGIIRSDMTAPVTEKYDRLIADGVVPAGRWGEGDDVARVVSALASGSFACWRRLEHRPALALHRNRCSGDRRAIGSDGQPD